MTKVRIAAMADLHTQEENVGAFRQVFEEVSGKADILLICGDLTNEGLVSEAKVLAEELSFCKIPMVGVLGNHDHENNQHEEIKKILSAEHLFLLGNHPYIYKGIGFAGVKGFCGGFDNHQTDPFGERVLKQFVYEAVNESIKLEESLIRLETDKKVVLLHYSPIRQTVVGESLEIYPMLGSSRLIEPIENFGVTAVFHGHAHHGSPKGKTARGVPVYNVSFPLLSRISPHQPYMILEI
ncbi:MAG: metallophosphoesterase [Patescibacteria group bacterium]|nr:metallophosphoesterase [Patescibacteria group bacterium]